MVTIRIGRAVAGLAIGMLTMIVPMYMSEVSTAGIRGTLVVLQQCKSWLICQVNTSILLKQHTTYSEHYSRYPC